MRSEPAPYCNDWSCPSRIDCAHFFGTSYEYAAMEPAKVRDRDREGQIVCGDYEEGTGAIHETWRFTRPTTGAPR